MVYLLLHFLNIPFVTFQGARDIARHTYLLPCPQFLDQWVAHSRRISNYFSVDGCIELVVVFYSSIPYFWILHQAASALTK